MNTSNVISAQSGFQIRWENGREAQLPYVGLRDDPEELSPDTLNRAATSPNL